MGGGGEGAELEILFRGGGGRRIFLPSERNTVYKIRAKMEQEQWLQLKMMFLFGYNLKIVI